MMLIPHSYLGPPAPQPHFFSIVHLLYIPSKTIQYKEELFLLVCFFSRLFHVEFLGHMAVFRLLLPPPRR